MVEPITLAKLTKEQFNEQTVKLTETIKGAGKAGARTQTRRQAGKKGKEMTPEMAMRVQLMGAVVILIAIVIIAIRRRKNSKP